MSELKLLIGRLEEATGPDMQLDADIAKAMGAFVKRSLLIPIDVATGSRSMHSIEIGQSVGWVYVPAYTSSIDAAVQLVPEGYSWHLWSIENGLPNAEVRDKSGNPYYGMGKGPISLCSAALKAIDAMRKPMPAAMADIERMKARARELGLMT